jgi:hypothetical protein
MVHGYAWEGDGGRDPPRFGREAAKSIVSQLNPGLRRQICDDDTAADRTRRSYGCLPFNHPSLFSADVALALYSCFFVNAANRFDSVEPVEAASDADALTHAKHLLRRERLTVAVEVWHQAELIGRVDRERT